MFHGYLELCAYTNVKCVTFVTCNKYNQTFGKAYLQRVLTFIYIIVYYCKKAENVARIGVSRN